jgi:DNA invertase Pin-like site-specific DNA recombinase
VHPCPAGDGAGPWALQAVTLGAELRERGIGLHVIEQGTGTGTMEGRARSGMLSVLAELRHELIVANTMDGLATARARGRIAGQSGTDENHAASPYRAGPPAHRP